MTFRLVAHRPAFWELVAPQAQLEKLAGGFQFLEGPVWDPRQQTLTFSDIVGDAMYRWNARLGVQLLRQPSHKANGNTYDLRGWLLTCEHATSRVSRTDPAGGYQVLATHYQGRELNSPNDIVVKSDGSIYFTDPNYGRRERVGVPRPQALPFQGVFRLQPESEELTLLADDFENPNGLCFDHAEGRLFVNDSPRRHIQVFQVLPDGSLAGGQVWAEVRGEGPGVPDGMKIDAAGNLYCCGPGGLHLFDAQANPLGLIGMPEQLANFIWGDPDLCSLYLTASTGLYRLRMRQPGYLPYQAAFEPHQAL
jgi:gluconolactonase